MKKKSLLFLLLFLMFFGVSVYAIETNNNEETQTPIVENKSIFDAGDNISFDKQINGTVALAGENITYKGSAEGIAFLGANSINYNGYASYLVGAGSSISVTGEVTNDIFLGGSSIVLKDIVVGRDVILGGSSITLSGTIERDLNIMGSTVEIDNVTVKGNVKINAGTISIGKDVVIESLEHNEDAIISIDEEATVGALSTFKAPTTETKVTVWDRFRQTAVSIMSEAILFMILILVFPKVFTKLLKQNNKNEAKDYLTLFGKGFLTLFACPLVAILLLITIFGVDLGFVLLVGYILLLLLATVFFDYTIGSMIWKKYIKKQSSEIVIGVVSIAVFNLIRMIPMIGIFTFLIGLGITSTCLLRKD